LPRGYHCGETEDLQYIVSELKKREPNTPLVAIGYSMGGNILLKWLGETGKDNPLQAAAAVSIPFEVGKCSSKLNKGFARVYQWSLLKELCRIYQQKFKQGPLSKFYKEIDHIKTLREFDELITAPLHGFKDADDYYEQSSSRPYLKKIQVPTLIIHAQDDPFTPTDSIPLESELSPLVSYILTEQGGHLGFVTGSSPWTSKFWIDEVLIKFVDNIF
jgi:predicted alpha/beta-fold hydrolase